MKWFRSWWQKANKKLVIAGFIALLAVIAMVITVVLLYGTGFVGKTLWDWLNLLGVLAIPVAVGFGTVWFTQAQQHRDQLLADKRAQADHDAAEKRAQTEREIATDNQREAALQAYINKMSELLIQQDLCKSKPDAEARIVARVLTLTVLPRLDGERKARVLQFLYESKLIGKDNRIVDLNGADLRGAILHEVDLRGVDLRGADLREAFLHRANLSEADLSITRLNRVVLIGADLLQANLHRAYLFQASLYKANLSKANLNEAWLVEANLSKADLSGADLREAYLSSANLIKAKVTTEQLDKATSLQGATLPDGSTHE